MTDSTVPSAPQHSPSRLAALLALSLAALATPRPANAADAPLQFNRDIRPILSDNCFACHGPDPGTRKAGLRLDTREGLFVATPKTPASVLPGNARKSPLWQRLVTKDPDDVMPPPDSHKELTDAQKEIVRRWIDEGAPWQPHWAFIRPDRPPVPSVQNSAWVRNPIDAFILRQLESRGLEPAPEADRRTLARRLSLDLTGLPPDPKVVEQFVNDPSPTAYEDLVRKWMDTPQWGEHRARYWLDAARYADTHGLHFDNYREMWPYRDWVIRAFNRNQPFDQFTLEQIAGDLLPNPTEEQLIATGFHRCNMTTNEGGTIEEENLVNYARDRVETTSWVWLGITANCASCHDHKFDPVTMRDFYSMAAYFRNTVQPGYDGNVKDSNPSIVVPQSPEDRARWTALPSDIAAQNAKLSARRAAATNDFEGWLSKTKSSDFDADLAASDLVVSAPLNEGEGATLRALRGPAHSVEPTGKLEWKPDGKLGPAAVLKPGATLLVGNAADFERDQAFSYGAWVQAPAGGRYESVLARMDQDKEFRGWDLFTHDRNMAAHLVHSWPNNALKVTTTGNPIKPGEWTHVFVTYDGSSKAAGVKIYINGKPAATRVEADTLTDSIRTDTPLRIGQRSKDQVFNGGRVQDVRVYQKQLDPATVLAIADSGPIQQWFALDPARRTPAQRDALFVSYLERHDDDYRSLRKGLAALETERDNIKKRSPVTHIQQEKKNSMPAARILFRGAYDQPRDAVNGNVFAALHPLPASAPTNRLGLAQWLIAPENPLTARVTVNRFWQELFGIGLVRTTEDFGIMGETPVNQALLDWLAVEFQSNGWDVKKFFKTIVLSSAYRQASVATPQKIEKDPANRLLSRGPRFRMDGEMIRDYALSVSGLLTPKIGGPSVKPYQPDGVWEAVAMPESNTRKYQQDSGDALYRRSLYTFWKRSAPPANLDLFNAPSRETSCVRRERTNTPLQALATLNDPQLIEAAKHVAQQSWTQFPGDPSRAIDAIARRLLARPLRDEEQRVAADSWKQLLAYYESHPNEAQKLLQVSVAATPTASAKSPSTSDSQSASLAALTLVANQFLNLDETLNK